MDLSKNYYAILNIEKDSNKDLIKKSYYKLSKKHHPDKGGDAVIFNLINEAYESLIDDENRNDYDKKSKFGANYDELYELLNYEFDNFAKAWKESDLDEFVKNEVLHVIIRLDEKFEGKVEYDRWMICKSCDGSGKDLESKIQIRDKSGRVIKTFDSADGCDFCDGTGIDWRGVKCGFCFGQGKVGANDCLSCKGEKRVLIKQKVKGITMPQDKDELKIEFMGHYSKEAPGRVGHLILIKPKI